MTLKDFLTSNNLPTSIEVQRSIKNNYKGTETKITWIKIAGFIDDQDYLVMSATLAAKYLEDKSILKTCQAQKSAEGWGLIMPATCEVVETVEL